jgi:enterochelin esterase-like enzyme
VLLAGVIAWRLLHPGLHPDRYGVRVAHLSLHSRLFHEDLDEAVVTPPRLRRGRRPLLVLLYGRGSSPDELLSAQLFAALESEGSDAPIVLLPNGDDASYWHDRATGRWATSVVREAIPDAVRAYRADPHRVAIGGFSMGGFGALDIARLHPGRFCAIGGHSAALFEMAGEATEGSFDDAEDFSRHDLFSLESHYGATPIWMDVGADDPFRKADSDYARVLRARGADITFRTWPGGHNGSYWRSHMDAYIRFYAAALSRCGTG